MFRVVVKLSVKKVKSSPSENSRRGVALRRMGLVVSEINQAIRRELRMKRNVVHPAQVRVEHRGHTRDCLRIDPVVIDDADLTGTFSDEHPSIG